jgi:hypothetical protein
MNHRRPEYIQQKEDELEAAVRELERLRTQVEMEELSESMRTVKYDDLIRALEFHVVEIRRQLDHISNSKGDRWEDLRANLDLALDSLRDSLGNLDARVSSE